MISLASVRNFAGALLLLSGVSFNAQAAEILFNTDPFAGSTALSTPGRQVVGNEQFLPTFDPNTDRFVFDVSVFGISGLSFFNGTAAGMPTSGVNVVVLQDTDNDANAATAFGAGNAANLLAAQIVADGPGFFIYHNSGLSLNRLVFSTNLNDNTADLKILARILAPTGSGAIGALPGFAPANFVATPEPATGLLTLLAGSALVIASRRRN